MRVRLARILVGVAVGLAALPSSAASASASAPSSPRCRAQQLRLTTHFLGEAAQQFTATFTFSNESGQACHLSAWPAIGLREPSSEAEPVRVRRVLQGTSLASVSPVLLPPRGSASFDLYGADFDAAADKPCPRTSVILVTPPGDATALTATVRLPNCGLLLVSPVISGKVDRQAWSVWASKLVLDADGIGSVRFGLTRSHALTELRRMFGTPSAVGVNTGCGPRYREVAWGDLIAEFRLNRFSGYRYVAAGYRLPIPGGPRAPAPHGPTADLSTATGITLDSTLGQVRAADRSLASIGTDKWKAKSGIVFVDAAARDPEPPSSRIIEIKTSTCGDY